MKLKCSVFCLIAQNAIALVNDTDSNSTEMPKLGNDTDSTQVKIGVFPEKMSCSNDDACPGEQWCIKGNCGDCESSEDCDWRYFYNWNNICKFGSKSSDDCPSEEVSAIGKCAECNWNSDCNSGMVCVSGECKEPLSADGNLIATH